MIDKVVVAELSALLLRDQPEKADVWAGHDRARPGSGKCDRDGGCVGQLVGEVLWSDEAEADDGLQAGDRLSRELPHSGQAVPARRAYAIHHRVIQQLVGELELHPVASEARHVVNVPALGAA